jgi:hypothetical protein
MTLTDLGGGTRQKVTPDETGRGLWFVQLCLLVF